MPRITEEEKATIESEMSNIKAHLTILNGRLRSLEEEKSQVLKEYLSLKERFVHLDRTLAFDSKVKVYKEGQRGLFSIKRILKMFKDKGQLKELINELEGKV
jgi:hypothetical protein